MTLRDGFELWIEHCNISEAADSAWSGSSRSSSRASGSEAQEEEEEGEEGEKQDKVVEEEGLARGSADDVTVIGQAEEVGGARGGMEEEKAVGEDLKEEEMQKNG